MADGGERYRERLTGTVVTWRPLPTWDGVSALYKEPVVGSVTYPSGAVKGLTAITLRMLFEPVPEVQE